MIELHKLSYSDDISLYALSAKDGVLSKVLVAVQGEWHGHSVSSFKIELSDIQKMKENFDKDLIDVVCDYEHQTLTSGIAPASGWIKSLLIEDGKLYAQVEWTDEAKVQIDTKQYKYVSPVFVPNTIEPKSGKNIGWTLHSVSLTNKPFLQELGEVIANKAQESISLKNEVISLTQQVQQLTGQLEKVNKEKAEYIVNKAIQERRLKSSQKEFALKLANDDIKAFESFIADNSFGITPAPNDMFANSVPFKQSTTIDDMVAIASKARI